ncbi:MAG: hypothetical protein CMF73_06325 [Maricaulis sp.]|nr:hypothetical protein [Maricaulis sp.]
MNRQNRSRPGLNNPNLFLGNKGQYSLLKFRTFARTLGKALKSRKFQSKRVGRGTLAWLFGSQDEGVRFERGGVTVFVGRERDYWLFNFDNGDGESDVVEQLGIGRLGDPGTRKVDGVGLVALLEWIESNL